MKHLRITILVLGVWATLASAAEHPDLWRLVAKSHAIVTGRLTVPVDQIQEAIASGKGRHVNITVTETRAVKGTPPTSPVVVVYWTERSTYEPSSVLLDKLNGKEAILFLTQSDEAGPNSFFTRAPDALQAFSPEGLTAVEAEVKSQEAILKGYQLPGIKDAEFRRVRKLVDSITHPERAEEALSELQSLGKASVPAMIHLMDDRRALTIKEIAVQNPPGHWEGIAHYKPQCVVDLMSILLGRVTGESFSDIYNGGSERERAAAVDAWRIYLHYSTIESEAERSSGDGVPKRSLGTSGM